MSYQQAAKEIFDDLGVFVGASLISRNTKNGPKPYIEVQYNPVLAGGKQHTGEPYKRGAFQDSLKSSAQVLTSLRAGDPVTLKVVLNGKFKNLVGLEAGHTDSPNKSPVPPKNGGGFAGVNNSTKASGTDYNMRAAKGQALNLAMTVAISENRAHDDDYILSLIPRMIKLGEAVQNDDQKRKASVESNRVSQGQKGIQERTATPTGSTGQQQSSFSSNRNSPSSIVDDLGDLFGEL